MKKFRVLVKVATLQGNEVYEREIVTRDYWEAERVAMQDEIEHGTNKDFVQVFVE